MLFGLRQQSSIPSRKVGADPGPCEFSNCLHHSKEPISFKLSLPICLPQLNEHYHMPSSPSTHPRRGPRKFPSSEKVPSLGHGKLKLTPAFLSSPHKLAWQVEKIPSMRGELSSQPLSLEIIKACIN